MSRVLVKLGTKYVEWSTVTDSPVSYGMTREQLEAFTKEEYGNEGLREIPARLARIERTGCSSHVDTLESLVAVNRAGPGETEATLEELIRYAEAPAPAEEG